MLAKAVNTPEVLESILDGLQELVDYDAAGIFLLGNTEGEIRAQVVRGYPRESLINVRQNVDEGIVGWVIRHGKAVVVNDVASDPRYVKTIDSIKCELAVPIVSGQNILGCINLESNKENAYTDDMVQHVETLASYAAVTLERTKNQTQLMIARQLERELQIARGIQVALLPRRPPELEGYDIAGINIPSRDVGGDYFDYIPITQWDLGLVIADVAGKGVPAGLIMSGLRGAIRTRVETTYSIRSILTGVNRFLYESTGPESFVTAFYGVLNGRNHQFTYVNAGHNPPMLLHADGRLVRLQAGGPLLGVLPNPNYQNATASLEPGAVLLMFTDGIVEAGAEAGEEFGDIRVEKLLREFADEPANVLAHELEREAARFSGKDGEIDDRTVIVVKRL